MTPTGAIFEMIVSIVIFWYFSVRVSFIKAEIALWHLTSLFDHQPKGICLVKVDLKFFFFENLLRNILWKLI